MSLQPGRYRLPPWYTDADQRAAVELVSVLFEQPLDISVLPEGALLAPQVAELCWSERGAALVQLSDHPRREERARAVLEQLSVPWVFWSSPLTREGSWTWLERQVKPPLVDRLHQALRSGRHVLTPYNLGSFDIDEAVGLVSDPLDLLALVRDTLAHRLEYAAEGLQPAAWRASLNRAAGARLAGRLRGRLRSEVAAAVAMTLQVAEGEEVNLGRGVLEELGLTLVAPDF